MTTKKSKQPKSLEGACKFFLKQFKHIVTTQMVYIAFGAYLFANLLAYTVIPEILQSIDMPLKLLKYSCYAIFLYKAFVDIKQDRKISLSVIIFAILSVLSFLFSRNKILLIFFCIMVGLRKMNISKLVKVAYYVTITVFLLTISLSLLGIIPNWVFFTRGSIARNSLGFVYATDCISIYLSIILMFFYLKHSEAKIFELTLLEVLNLFLYKATDGRLSFTLITILLTVLALNRLSQLIQINIKNKCITTLKKTKRQLRQWVLRNHFIQIVIKTVCYILPAILFITYNFLSIAYMNNPQSMDKVNDILSSRLELTAKAYTRYGAPLFGKSIIWQGFGGYGYIDEINTENFEYNFIDSSYALLVFDFGIFYTLAVLIAYTCSLVYYLKKKKYWALMAIIFILTWAFIEPYLINMARNPLVILLIPALELGPNLQLKRRKIEQTIAKNCYN